MKMIQRVNKVQQLMQAKHYDLYLVPSSDPHDNEYVPTCWQRRHWVSGFDGSAGEVVITQQVNFLWTDGRYTTQAKQQLDSTCFQVKPQSGFTSEFEGWFQENGQGKTLAIDPATISIYRAQNLIKIANDIGAKIVFDPINLVDQVRQTVDPDALVMPLSSVMIQATQYTGASVDQKLSQVRFKMQQNQADQLVVTLLDEIAWLLNIRGQDIDFNPLVISYVIVTMTNCYLYIDQTKVSKEVKQYFHDNKIELMPYESFIQTLEQQSHQVLWIDTNKANYRIFQALQSNITCIEKPTPIGLFKAIKNATELEGMQTVHCQDAVAMMRFMHWLEHHWQSGVSELDAVEQLYQFRSQQAGFQSNSFSMISSFGANGAIIHYSPTPETNQIITDKNLYLFDSGGQYLQGTTDVTRVIHLGQPTAEQKMYYTLVLKGHLALRHTPFTKGTCGEHLDALARQPLWQQCINYAHGTGHGVGSFLCVHEGPQKISPAISHQPLQPGMIVSNEPGIYFPDHYGIRIENLCQITQIATNSGPTQQDFYQLQDLTLVPYALDLIDVTLLTHNEINQINMYHDQIRKYILPKLPSELTQWAMEKVQPIG